MVNGLSIYMIKVSCEVSLPKDNVSDIQLSSLNKANEKPHIT